MITRQDYILSIGHLVSGDNFPIGEAEMFLAILLSLAEHSNTRPLIIVQDVTGDDGFDYPVTTFTSWSEGFSIISQVEYEVDDDSSSANILLPVDWIIYNKPDGKYLRFLTSTPSTSEEFRVTYSARHTCTDSACTVKDADDYVCRVLAAAYFCEMLATAYAPSSDSMIEADSVDHKSKSKDYAMRSKVYRSIYFKHFGLKDGSVPAASVTQDWDKLPSWQSDRITHPNRYR